MNEYPSSPIPLPYIIYKIMSMTDKETLEPFKRSIGVDLVVSVEGSDVRQPLHARFLAHCPHLSPFLYKLVQSSNTEILRIDIPIKPEYPAMFSENIESLITWSELTDEESKKLFVLGLSERGVEWMKGMHNLVDLLGIDDFRVVNEVQNLV
jgi:hypothetical protein